MFAKVINVFNAPAADPVAKTFPLLGSAWPVTFIILAYLLFVLKYGKKFMEHRESYNLKRIIVVYNLCQVIYNALMFSFIFYYIWIARAYNLRCMETLPCEHPRKNTERWISYVFYINKIIDLLDTVFFVLRKSYKQITMLHVYHHIMMVYTIYWVVHFYGFGGQYSMMAFVNTFVHTVMYFYYFISAMYPELKGNLWWKKYITRLQLLQFILLFSQAAHVLIFNSKCKFPFFMHFMQLFQSTAMIVMFGNFYRKAYCNRQSQQQKIQ